MAVTRCSSLLCFFLPLLCPSLCSRAVRYCSWVFAFCVSFFFFFVFYKRAHMCGRIILVSPTPVYAALHFLSLLSSSIMWSASPRIKLYSIVNLYFFSGLRPSTWPKMAFWATCNILIFDLFFSRRLFGFL